MHDGWILLLAFPIGAAVGIAVAQIGLRAGLPIWAILLIAPVVLLGMAKALWRIAPLVLLGMARAIGHWRT